MLIIRTLSATNIDGTSGIRGKGGLLGAQMVRPICMTKKLYQEV